MRARSPSGTDSHRRWAARARATASVTSAGVETGSTASGAPVSGVSVVTVPPSPEATTRAVSRRTRLGSSA